MALTAADIDKGLRPNEKPVLMTNVEVPEHGSWCGCDTCHGKAAKYAYGDAARNGPAGPPILAQSGLFLRDEFAKAALIGILSGNEVGESRFFVAERAYAMADAMMEVRESK